LCASPVINADAETHKSDTKMAEKAYAIFVAFMKHRKWMYAYA